MDYSTLTDDEIRSQLTAAGLPVGPIVDSTRKVYIRKLRRLAGEQEETSQTNDADAMEDEESEPEPSPPRQQRPMTAKTRTPPSSSGEPGGLRQRTVSQKKLDVPITAEIQQSAGGGITGFLIKLLLFLVLCGAVLYAVGLFEQLNNPQSEQ